MTECKECEEGHYDVVVGHTLEDEIWETQRCECCGGAWEDCPNCTAKEMDRLKEEQDEHNSDGE